jgi:hypothetical protein
MILLEHIYKETKTLSISEILKKIIQIIKYEDYIKTLDQSEER